jgi:hypothetical protein
MTAGLILLALAIPVSAQDAWIEVEADREGLTVWLDGTTVGKTPIESLKVSPGEHTVSLFSSEEIEDAYWAARTAPPLQAIGKFIELRKFDAATRRINVASGQKVRIFLSLGEAERAPGRMRFCLIGGLGGVFLVGGVTGFLLASLL